MLEADMHQQMGAHSNGIDLLSFLQKNNISDLENMNPLMSLASLSMQSHQNSNALKRLNESLLFSENHPNLNSVNAGFKNSHLQPKIDENNCEDDLERCLMNVFEEILLEENPASCSEKKSKSKNTKKETDVLKSISLNSMDSSSRLMHKATVETSIYNSIAPSCSSPLSLKDDETPLSPAAKLALNNSKVSTNSTSSLSSTNVTSKSASSSVMLFRSINSSNTIYVQPSDIIIPLSEGEYNEYKLFPNSSNNNKSINVDKEQNHILEKIFNNLGAYGDDSCDGSYSPLLSSPSAPSSASLTSNSSSLNASPISTSPLLLPRHHHVHHHHQHSFPNRQYLIK
jgi:hypothetical protein